jgi:hypothetical protein
VCAAAAPLHWDGAAVELWPPVEKYRSEVAKTEGGKLVDIGELRPWVRRFLARQRAVYARDRMAPTPTHHQKCTAFHLSVCRAS